MPKVRIITPGRNKEGWITEGCEHYLKLLSRYAEATVTYLPSLKSVRSLSPEEIMAREAEQFEKHLEKGLVIALDTKGRATNSKEFARLLNRYQNSGRSPIIFLIGGAYGLDAKLLTRADAIVSLSELTFSHQLVRLIFLEQLYRAYSILHGTPYHK